VVVMISVPRVQFRWCATGVWSNSGTRLNHQSQNRTAAGYAVPKEYYTPASA
jgi:hypothetical protein